MDGGSAGFAGAINRPTSILGQSPTALPMGAFLKDLFTLEWQRFFKPHRQNPRFT